jgi:hypothetical protein
VKLSKERYEAAAAFGYCQTYLDWIKDTEDSEGVKRIEKLKSHIDDCNECKLAATLKTVEYEVAVKLNALHEFHNNIDITRRPGFKEAFKEVISHLPLRLIDDLTEKIKKLNSN